PTLSPYTALFRSLDEPLSEELIKAFHFELKSGVFEDRANGYAIGDYKERPNMVGMYETALPKEVPEKMRELLAWYHGISVKTLSVMAQFHRSEERRVGKEWGAWWGEA